MKYRFVEKTTPPPAKTRPDSAQSRATTPPSPSKNAVAAPADTSLAATSAQRGGKALQAPAGPPADATLLCIDGTYLSGQADAARCAPHGGLVAKLPRSKP